MVFSQNKHLHARIVPYLPFLLLGFIHRPKVDKEIIAKLDIWTIAELGH
jgi:hypothetical protein